MELPESNGFDDDDAPQNNLMEHIEQVREIFKQIDPSGKRGLDYDEFKTVLTEVLKVDFEEDSDSLNEILADLDPHRTGYVKFDALYRQWTQQEDDDDMEQHFEYLENIQSKFGEDEQYSEPQFGGIEEQETNRRTGMSIIDSMRNSLKVLTFGDKRDKQDYLDATQLNRFLDLFHDYKEKKHGSEEFHLDLTKELQFDKYSIKEKELVAFFGRMKDEKTIITETEFNEILISFDQSFRQSIELERRSNLRMTMNKNMNYVASAAQIQKLDTIITRLQQVPKFKEDMSKELKSVAQACIEDNGWEVFQVQPDRLQEFFKNLCQGVSAIHDKMEFLNTRHTQNQSLLTDLKLTQSHLIDDKEKYMIEKNQLTESLEELTNTIQVMEEKQRQFEEIKAEKEMLRINFARITNELADIKPKMIKLQTDYDAVLEYNEELQVKLGEVAMERDDYRQIIFDMGQESLLIDQRKSSINLQQIRPPTPKRSLEEIEQHRRRLDDPIIEEDEIDPEVERQHLERIEALIGGSTKSIGPDQGESLLAIRKEYIRREQTIRYAMKTVEQLEQDYDALQTENDELTDSIVLQLKYNQELNKQCEELNFELHKVAEDFKRDGSVHSKNYQFKKVEMPKFPGDNNPILSQKLKSKEQKFEGQGSFKQEIKGKFGTKNLKLDVETVNFDNELANFDSRVSVFQPQYPRATNSLSMKSAISPRLGTFKNTLQPIKKSTIIEYPPEVEKVDMMCQTEVKQEANTLCQTEVETSNQMSQARVETAEIKSQTEIVQRQQESQTTPMNPLNIFKLVFSEELNTGKIKQHQGTQCGELIQLKLQNLGLIIDLIGKPKPVHVEFEMQTALASLKDEVVQTNTVEQQENEVQTINAEVTSQEMQTMLFKLPTRTIGSQPQDLLQVASKSIQTQEEGKSSDNSILAVQALSAVTTATQEISPTKSLSHLRRSSNLPPVDFANLKLTGTFNEDGKYQLPKRDRKKLTYEKESQTFLEMQNFQVQENDAQTNEMELQEIGVQVSSQVKERDCQTHEVKKIDQSTDVDKIKLIESATQIEHKEFGDQQCQTTPPQNEDQSVQTQFLEFFTTQVECQTPPPAPTTSTEMQTLIVVESSSQVQTDAPILEDHGDQTCLETQDQNDQTCLERQDQNNQTQLQTSDQNEQTLIETKEQSDQNSVETKEQSHQTSVETSDQCLQTQINTKSKDMQTVDQFLFMDSVEVQTDVVEEPNQKELIKREKSIELTFEFDRVTDTEQSSASQIRQSTTQSKQEDTSGFNPFKKQTDKDIGFEIIPLDEDKKNKLVAAGQSLKASMLQNIKIRASTINNPSFIKKKETIANVPKVNKQEQMVVPAFDLQSSDYLGVLSSSYNRLLGIKQMQGIRAAVTKNEKVKDLDQLPYLFSDYVEKFNAQLKRETSLLIITQTYFYLISLKDLILLSAHPLTNLSQVLIVRSNDSLVGLKMKTDGKDQFLESIRREDIVSYLFSNSEKLAIAPPKVVHASRINLSQQKHSQIINTRTTEFKARMNLQKNFISLATVSGYLQTLDFTDILKQEEKDKKGWSLFGGKSKKGVDDYKWEERFYVLGSLGLIIMEKPNSDKIDFYSFNQFKIEAVAESKYGRKFSFEITPRGQNSEDANNSRMVLQAPSDGVMQNWVKKLQDHQNVVFKIIHEKRNRFLQYSQMQKK